MAIAVDHGYTDFAFKLRAAWGNPIPGYDAPAAADDGQFTPAASAATPPLADARCGAGAVAAGVAAGAADDSGAYGSDVDAVAAASHVDDDGCATPCKTDAAPRARAEAEAAPHAEILHLRAQLRKERELHLSAERARAELQLKFATVSTELEHINAALDNIGGKDAFLVVAKYMAGGGDARAASSACDIMLAGINNIKLSSSAESHRIATAVVAEAEAAAAAAAAAFKSAADRVIAAKAELARTQDPHAAPATTAADAVAGGGVGAPKL